VIGLGLALKVGAVLVMLLAIGLGTQRVYQAGFDAASREAHVRELQAKEQARALSAKLVQVQIDKHRRMDHETQRALALARERADASRHDLERLRSKLATLSADPVRADPGDTATRCDGIRAERDRLAALLAEGASLVAEGQRRGDELAVRLDQLSNTKIRTSQDRD
jgi:hypothetical protein